MLKNYFTVALRSLRRRSGYAALHVAGLAVGLACCFVVLLYVDDERSFDRFHARAERIYHVSKELIFEGTPLRVTSAGADEAEAIAAGVAGVEAVVQMREEAGLVRRPGAAEGFEDAAILYASDRFFEVFSFPLRRGDPASVLAAPGRVVLSETAARTYFGDADPVGQPLLLEPREASTPGQEPLALVVSGVAADPPGPSTVQFSLVVSGRTERHDGAARKPALAGGGTTFVLTRTPQDRAALEAALLAQLGEREDGFSTIARVLATPLPALHFAYGTAGTFAGNPRYLYLFSAIAVVVLLIACVNYTNLATAYAARRAKEVGVRKTLGASRTQLARQFLVETLLLAAAAAALAVGLVEVALPAFNRLFDKRLAFEWASDAPLLLAMLALVAGVGLVAGGFPALYLSRFLPADILRGRSLRGRGGARLRQVLVVLQFAATVALLIATAVIYEQLRFSRTRDLGFDGSHVLTLDLTGPATAAQQATLRNVMGTVPGVRQATLSSAVPGQFRDLTLASPLATAGDPADDVFVPFAQVDAGFLATYGVALTAGRFFTEGEGAGLVVNERAARTLGLMTDDPAEAVGRRLFVGDEQEVIGVVADFHVASLHRAVGPVVLQPLGGVQPGLTLSLKLDGRDLAATLAAVEQAWKPFARGYPFAYRFVDDAFDALYRADRQLGQIFGGVAAIAVLLACSGLLGLAAYAAERRTKEIGVRKVLGASARDIVVLLSREFVALVLAGAALATPFAWAAMHRWLADFAYHIELSWHLPLLAALAALTLALSTVSYQAVRAALADPVKSLRYE